MKVILLIGAIISISLLNACGPSIHDKSIAYKTSTPAKPLVFPPNLIADETDINTPNTLTSYAQVKIPDLPKEVLPKFRGIKFVSNHGERWLESTKSPDELWDKLIDFWTKKIGVEIAETNKPAGLISTQWAENRAELNSGFIRQYLRKIADFAYSTDTRDKFFIRLERNGDLTEIFINHQQMVQIAHNETFIWTQGKNNPTLEAEVLSRLMVFLGADRAKTDKIDKKIIPRLNLRASLITLKSGTVQIKVLESFPKTWRRTGNALRSSGIEITDLNRSIGNYYIIYADPTETDNSIFTKNDKKISYDINVSKLTNNTTLIKIYNSKDHAITTQSAARIMEILHQQLK